MFSINNTTHNKYYLPTVVFASIFLIFLGIVTHDAHADVLSGILSANNTSVPTAGLVAEWRFENNAFDTSGNGHNGVTSGGATYVSGKIGEALNFGGTGIDRIPYSSTLDFPTTSFSTSLWIKTTSSNLGLIVDHRRNNDACYAGYSIEDGGSGHLVGRLRICAPATDTAANFDVLTNTVNDGSWHNVVFVVDRANHVSRIYQDDVLVNSLDISALGNISQTSIGVDLGYTGNPNTPSDPFVGTLDQIRVYNRTLSSNEVNSLYNEQFTKTVPSPPQNLQASAASSQINLSWSAPSNNGGSPITGYKVYRSTSSGTETLLTTSGNLTSYSDTTAITGTTYFYKASSVNSVGESPQSNEASATISQGPSAPQNLAATAVSSSQVNLSWSAPSNNGGSSITGYKIERSTDGGSTWSTILPNTGNSGTSYSDSGLSQNTAYTYRVSAINSAGTSNPSNTASATTLSALVGEWKFEGNTQDTSNYSNNAINHGAVFVPGKIGQALSFDGTSAEIDVPNSASLNFGTAGSFTISTWVKSTQSGGGEAGYGLIIDHRRNNDGTYAGYSIEDNSGTIYARVRDSSAHDVATTSTSNVNDGIFHNIVFVVDRSAQTEKLYIDNNLQSSQSIASVGNINAAFDLYMGGTASPNTPVDFFNGIIDQTRIYSKALSDSEIQALFNEPAPAGTGVTLNGIESTSGNTSPSNQITLANFNAGTGNNRLLVVGVSTNNNDVASVTFGGVQLSQSVKSFYNNDAEFWYLKNPVGTGNIVVTTSGSTSAVIGAYSLSGVDQANPVPTSTTNHNTASNSPTISITTQYPNSMVLDLPSIYGGVTLGSPTCTQGWDLNVPDTITGASSSMLQSKTGSATCSWTASQGGDLWDDVAIEVKASSP